MLILCFIKDFKPTKNDKYILVKQFRLLKLDTDTTFHFMCLLQLIFRITSHCFIQLKKKIKTPETYTPNFKRISKSNLIVKNVDS